MKTVDAVGAGMEFCRDRNILVATVYPVDAGIPFSFCANVSINCQVLPVLFRQIPNQLALWVLGSVPLRYGSLKNCVSILFGDG